MLLTGPRNTIALQCIIREGEDILFDHTRAILKLRTKTIAINFKRRSIMRWSKESSLLSRWRLSELKLAAFEFISRSPIAFNGIRFCSDNCP